MYRLSRYSFALSLTALLAACPEDPTSTSAISVTVTPSQVPADGSSRATIVVTTDPGVTVNVTLNIDRGKFTENNDITLTKETSGSLRVEWTACSATENPCLGTGNVLAAASGVSAFGTVQFMTPQSSSSSSGSGGSGSSQSGPSSGSSSSGGISSSSSSSGGSGSSAPSSSSSSSSSSSTGGPNAPVFGTLTASPDPAKAGHTVIISFTSSLPLVSNPTVTVAGNPAGFSSFTDSRYRFAYVVTGNEPAGRAPIVITGTSTLGGTGTGGGTVMLDSHAPVASTLAVVRDVDGTHVSGIFALSAPFSDGDGTGIERCEVCVSTDGTCNGEWTAAAYTSGSCRASGLSCIDGSTVLMNLRAVDVIGNVGEGTALTRACDGLEPTGLAVELSPSTSSHVGSAFTATAAFTDSGSGVRSCEVCVSRDGLCDNEWRGEPTTTFANGTCTATGQTCIDGQTLLVAMRATDGAGLRGNAGALSVVCDGVPPTAGVVVPSNNGHALYVPGSFSVTTAFPDGSGGGVSTCEVCKSTDGTCDDEWTPATVASGACTAAGLTCTQGEQVTLNMRGKDPFNAAVAEAAAVTFTCDATAPPAPDNVALIRVPSGLKATWDSVVDSGGTTERVTYNVHYGRAPTPPLAGSDAREGASPIRDIAALEQTLSRLPVCVRFYAAVSASDAVGQEGPLSTVASGTVCGADGTFEMAVGPSGAPYFGGVAVADFNGDGAKDVVAGEAGLLHVYLGVEAFGHGTGSFRLASSATTGSSTSRPWVGTGDFNGDGIMDAFAHGSDWISVNLATATGGVPDGTLQNGITLALAGLGGLLTARTGDVNADGRLDVVASTNYDDLVVLLGNGDGTLTIGPVSPVDTWYVYDIALVDFDRDGILDVVLADDDYQTPGIRLVRGGGSNGRGDGTFTDFASVTVPTTEEPAKILVEDFDGDHMPDIALLSRVNVSTSLQSTAVRFIKNNGDGTFTAGAPVKTTASTNDRASTLVPGDYNSDGIPDVALLGDDSSYDAFAQPFFNAGTNGRGTGVFSPGPLTRHESLDFTYAVAADVNSDGLTDIVSGNYWSSSIPFVALIGGGARGTPTGTLALGNEFSTGGAGTMALAGDFNDDAVPDVAVLRPSTSSVSIMTGVGDRGLAQGSFATPTVVAAGSSPMAMALGDFNSDGITDIATANNNTSGYSIVLGNGTGGAANGTFASPIGIFTNASASALAIGDFNGDRRQDIAGVEAAGIRILLGNGSNGRGDGTFASGAVTSLIGAREVVARDVNADQITDLVVGTQSGLVVLLGNGTPGLGDGTFTAQAAVGTAALSSLVVAEVSGDAVLDVVALDASTGTLNIFAGRTTAGRPNGTFAMPSTTAVGAAPTALILTDLNRDDVLDAVVSSAASGTVSVLRGGGSHGVANRSFGTPTVLSVGTQPWGLVSADYDSNGTPDVAVSLAGGGALKLLMNEVHVGAGLPSSYFDVDTEGWRIWGDVGYDFMYPEFQAAGGNPGGRLGALITDDDRGTVYFHAPGKFVGDKSAYYGLVLMADVISETVGEDTGTYELILQSGTTTVGYHWPHPAGTVWTRFATPISADYGWMSRGQPATEAQLRGVLANLTALYIRATFGPYWYHDVYLDNVHFVP